MHRKNELTNKQLAEKILGNYACIERYGVKYYNQYNVLEAMEAFKSKSLIELQSVQVSDTTDAK